MQSDVSGSARPSCKNRDENEVYEPVSNEKALDIDFLSFRNTPADGRLQSALRMLKFLDEKNQKKDFYLATKIVLLWSILIIH